MIATRATLIRAGAGRVRVLRLRTIGRVLMLLPYEVRHNEAMCQRCGCTELLGCPGGCYWATAAHDLCSRCAGRMVVR
jgi:hypothetical protein